MTDKQLIRFATQFRKGILGKKPSRDHCWAVSAPLCAMLTMQGVYTTLMRCYVWLPQHRHYRGKDGKSVCEIEHYFLGLQDGRILDPTGDQFDYLGRTPKMPLDGVYLGPQPAWYQKRGYEEAVNEVGVAMEMIKGRRK